MSDGEVIYSGKASGMNAAQRALLRRFVSVPKKMWQCAACGMFWTRRPPVCRDCGKKKVRRVTLTDEQRAKHEEAIRRAACPEANN
jgi:hypothetical protein